eukprot:jgi/Ulvmu1/8517/UM044_0051.1
MSAFDKLIESLDTSSGVTWLEGLLGPELISNTSGKSDIVPTASCSGKYIGLYFSAKWCGPCKMFTPVLRKSYEAWKQSGKHKFEIIFMSLDRTQPEFNEYFASMPWLAPQQLKVCQKLAERVSVMSIPTLFIISPEGKLMTSNGVACIRKDPEGLEFPWEGQAQSNSSFNLWIPLIVLMLVYYVFRYYFEGRKSHGEEDGA